MGLGLPSYIDWAYKIFVPHQNVGHADSKYDGENPSANKSFHGLLWREFDELCTAECDATNIGKDIIANDQGDGQEEPNHSFKDIIHDKVGLNHNKVKSHVCPCKLSKLESIVPRL
jgi:hypothetical protein